ncbi:hypothetical protein SAMN06265795_101362 [Noviherbaspirillum humi]|uniref:LppC lipoprotein n=2 Tax=Noviherbaspirillum humi TaxID=1688639 RepID=A0A239CC40_9BURK|nr:hypothetical protein SAMN06265795_101362 [Noviherbaspirillum humi]
MLALALCGLCLPAQANTTLAQANVEPGVESAAPIQLTPAPALGQAPAVPRARLSVQLPGRSDAFRSAAEAVQAGLRAAHERDPGDIRLDIAATGDNQQEIVSSYRAATADSDIIIGPLPRSGVTAVSKSGAVNRPTIALSQTDAASADLPWQLLAIGLSVEDEARQAARWAAAEQKERKAIVIATGAARSQRAARAFASQWQAEGRSAEVVELPASGGVFSAQEVTQMKRAIGNGRDSLLFAPLTLAQARQARAVLGNGLPMYATSQMNEGGAADSDPQAAAVLNGVRLLDIPWLLQRDHPAVMIYPRRAVPVDTQPDADMERLYALGIDAYRIAYEMAKRRSEFELDGVTGRLTVRYEAATRRFERTLQPAVWRDGTVVPLQENR